MILCCTKKALDKLKKHQPVENIKTEIDLYTWYLDLVAVSRKKYFLCVHAQSLTAFIFYAGTQKEYKNIQQLFEENLKKFFSQEIGRSAQQFEKLFPKDKTFRFVKTNSRSVLGNMRDMMMTLDYFNGESIENRIPEIVRSLNYIIRKTKGEKYFKPTERLRELIGYDESDKSDDLEGGKAIAKNRLTFKISLHWIKPEIWRRISVSDNMRFDRFHQVIQLVMGWQNCHLHDFKIGDREIGMPTDDDWDGVFEHVEDEATVYLNDFDWKEQDAIMYTYDYGDSWEHRIVLDKIEASEEELPQLLDGGEACPLEDIGGVTGHTNFREAYGNPEHEYYDLYFPDGHENFEMPDFSLEEHRAVLKTFGEWNKRFPWRRSTPWHRVE